MRCMCMMMSTSAGTDDSRSCLVIVGLGREEIDTQRIKGFMTVILTKGTTIRSHEEWMNSHDLCGR